MKRITTLCAIVLFATLTLTAQPPQAFKYKSIAKNRWGLPLINRNISLRFSILQGSENGIPVYIEEHQVTTNIIGLMDVNIGQGTPQLGDFPGIDWGADDYYIKTELDQWGGNNFRIQDEAHQLLSVPYALYAGGVLDKDDDDADPANELISSVLLNGTFLEIAEGGVLTIIDLSGLQDGTEDADADPENELQDLEINDHSLSITNGSTITLPDNTEDADADPENEIQDLQLTGNILTITKNGTATEVDLSVYLDDTDTRLTEAEVDAMVDNNGYLTGEEDGDVTNEIQDLSLSEHQLSLTDDDTPVDLSPYMDNTDTHLTEAEVDAMVDNNGYLTSEADGDATNELQDMSIEGHMLSITNGSTVQIPDSVNDADHDPMNELQVLSLDGNMLILSNNGIPYEIDLSPYMDNRDEQILLIDDHELTIFNGNTIQIPDTANDADHDPVNELQDLSLEGTNLTISQGNSVDMTTIINEIEFADPSPTNELQNLSYSDGILSISNGNWVNIGTSSGGAIGGGLTTSDLLVAARKAEFDYERTCYNYIQYGYTDWFFTNLTSNYTKNGMIEVVYSGPESQELMKLDCQRFYTLNSLIDTFEYIPDPINYPEHIETKIKTVDICPGDAHLPTMEEWGEFLAQFHEIPEIDFYEEYYGSDYPDHWTYADFPGDYQLDEEKLNEFENFNAQPFGYFFEDEHVNNGTSVFWGICNKQHQQSEPPNATNPYLIIDGLIHYFYKLEINFPDVHIEILDPNQLFFDRSGFSVRCVRDALFMPEEQESTAH